MFLVTIDCSISSTGVCIFNRETKTYAMFGHPTQLKLGVIRKTLRNFNEDTEIYVGSHEVKLNKSNYTLFAEAQPSAEGTNDFARYVHTAKKLFLYILNHVGDEKCDFYMEEYAFGRQAGRMMQMAEFASLLKYFIYSEFGNVMRPLYNSTVKKCMVGNGRAKKPEVHDYFRANDPMMEDFYSTLELYGVKTINSFIEDITDAYMMNRYVQEYKEG